jgi:hypothetical protein
MFFGIGEFVQGVNFNCTSRACYGVGYVPDSNQRVGDLFELLQVEANIAALAYGLDMVDADELISDTTVTLINKLAQRSSIGALAHAPFTKEKVAREAQALIETIRRMLAGETAPPPTIAPPKQPTPTTAPPTPITTTTTVTEMYPAATIPAKTKIIAGVVVGAVALGGTIAAVSIARSRREKPSTRGGPTRKARRG